MKELQLNVVLDTTNEVTKVIESSKEDSISTPVAIHIDRIPLINIIEKVYAYDSGITLVGPERKWVFETWRVEDINNTTLPIVDLSFDLDLSNLQADYIEVKEYIILRPLYSSCILDGFYGMEDTEDTAEMYYAIPVPNDTDTMVWIENVDTIIMTKMSNIVNYNLHTLKGSETKDGIIIIPSSSEQDALLKPTVLNSEYKDQDGNMKYNSYIDDNIIIAPRYENATIGWFMDSIKTLRSLRKNNVQ